LNIEGRMSKRQCPMLTFWSCFHLTGDTSTRDPSNQEVLFLFCLAVPMRITKIEINWLFSSNNRSSSGSGTIRLCRSKRTVLFLLRTIPTKSLFFRHIQLPSFLVHFNIQHSLLFFFNFIFNLFSCIFLGVFL
jgi:hypothetical protein